MSFFGKIKQGLGIGTASIELTIPGQVSKESGEVRGKLTVTAKSDQKVKSISVKLVETYTKGTGENKTVKEYMLGEMPIGPGTFDLKTGEQKEIEFVLPFSLKLSSAQALAEKGGVLGALGKAAVFTSNEKSEFHLKAWADLEGVALDPVDVKRVELK